MKKVGISSRLTSSTIVYSSFSNVKKLKFKKKNVPNSPSSKIISNEIESETISNENESNGFKISNMTLSDLSECFSIGERIFNAELSNTLYRTWDQFGLAGHLHDYPEYALVATNTNMNLKSSRSFKKKNTEANVIGFVLGSVLDHHGKDIGYVEWIVIRPSYQRSGVGTALYNEVIKRMSDEYPNICEYIVDTPTVNIHALNFFQNKLNFSNQAPHCYLSLNLKAKKETNNINSTNDKKLLIQPDVKSNNNNTSNVIINSKHNIKLITREMELKDLNEVYKLGCQTFQGYSTLTNTWTEDTVLQSFTTDCDNCIVCEREDGVIAGFALGTIFERKVWKYGYLVWMAVNPLVQRGGVGKQLFQTFKKLMKENKCHMILLDTQKSNKSAISFFNYLGFKESSDSGHVYLSKIVENNDMNHTKSITML